MNKTTTISIVVAIIIIIGLYFIFRSPALPTPTDQNPTTTPLVTGSTASPSVKPAQVEGATTMIGKSIEGRDMIAYNYGTGSIRLLFVGGIHGGYEWNTSLLAYELMDYLAANPEVVPANLKVTIIPVLNPDGLSKVVSKTGAFTASDVSGSESQKVSGRFNANGVDLNRNFDCDWQTKGVWQNKSVSGGEAAFSEPESLAMKNYIESAKPAAVVVWYSAAGGVYSSNCHGGVLPETDTITKVFADASGYPAYKSFDFYATTGDMVNWLAKINIPAVSVLLTNHTSTELTKNKAGLKALLDYYSK